MTERNLTFLPRDVRSAAKVQSNSEVLWRLNDAASAINALADSHRCVLGLDIREYDDDGKFYEFAWSSFEPTGKPDDVELGRFDALSALKRENDWSERLLKAENWVLVAWATPERLAELREQRDG